MKQGDQVLHNGRAAIVLIEPFRHDDDVRLRYVDTDEYKFIPRSEIKERPTFPTIYMNLAVGLSERSTCLRGTRVGCVITTVDFRRVLAVGYNGNAAGLSNHCDVIGEAAVGNCGCIHAEENAVISCTEHRSTEKIVFSTHLPCSACAKRIIQLGGVVKVLYLNDYRKKEGLGMLSMVGIDHKQMLKEGT